MQSCFSIWCLIFTLLCSSHNAHPSLHRCAAKRDQVPRDSAFECGNARLSFTSSFPTTSSWKRKLTNSNPFKMSTEINCNGLAEHFQPPERGTLRVLIRKEGNDRAAVSLVLGSPGTAAFPLTLQAHKLSQVTQEVTKKANELAEALKKLSPKDEKGGLLDTAPVTFWSTTTLSTRTVWQPDKTATRYESSVTFTSKFRDFDTVSVSRPAEERLTRELVQASPLIALSYPDLSLSTL